MTNMFTPVILSEKITYRCKRSKRPDYQRRVIGSIPLKIDILLEVSGFGNNEIFEEIFILEDTPEIFHLLCSEMWYVTEYQLREFFNLLPENRASLPDFTQIIKLCKLPSCLRSPFFNACVRSGRYDIDKRSFLKIWKQMCDKCYDLPEMFIRILTKSSSVKTLSDKHFRSLIQDVIATHPKLKIEGIEARHKHNFYLKTVVSKIYYDVNTSWSGKITLTEIRQSKLMLVILALELDNTNNFIDADYFSYEDYEVIYEKFSSLLKESKIYINEENLSCYESNALSRRIISRIFKCIIKRDKYFKTNEIVMDYKDFVWFYMSEVDKSHPRSIEYWFKCMDLNGDGYLSIDELKYFYIEQSDRMKNLKTINRCISFEDFISPIFSMVNPRNPNKISLVDLKACKHVAHFFNAFINIEKYINYI